MDAWVVQVVCENYGAVLQKGEKASSSGDSVVEVFSAFGSTACQTKAPYLVYHP